MENNGVHNGRREGSHVDRNGVQIGFNISPQSRFVVLACFWISIASNTLLLQYLGSCSKTLASSQSTQCCCSDTCTAIPFLVSHLRTAALCSTKLFCRFLPVSPMYTFSQSLQGILHTTLFCSICDLLPWSGSHKGYPVT